MTDYSTREGAVLLKMKIQKYWNDRGYRVRVKIPLSAALVGNGDNPVIGLRSDMVNGLPVRKI